jgi:hypothetical protein
MNQPTRIDLLELDLDLRLTNLWADALDVQEWDLEAVGAFMRASYGLGRVDALTDPDPHELFHAHGYAPPERRKA